MTKITQRPKLTANKRYKLKSNSGAGFVVRTNPVSHSTEENEARTFTGGYLNETCFDWQHAYQATETQTKQTVKPRRK